MPVLDGTKGPCIHDDLSLRIAPVHNPVLSGGKIAFPVSIKEGAQFLPVHKSAQGVLLTCMDNSHITAIGIHHFGRTDLGDHTAGSHLAGRFFGIAFHLTDIPHVGDSLCLRVFMGIVIVQPVDITHQDQDIPVYHRNHERSQGVIVPHLDFLYRQGIIFIYDRDHPIFQQGIHSIFQIGQAFSVIEVPVVDQYLGTSQMKDPEEIFIMLHQFRLPHRCQGLFLGHGGRFFLNSQDPHAGRLSTGRYQDHIHPLPLDICQLRYDLQHLLFIYDPLVIGKG